MHASVAVLIYPLNMQYIRNGQFVASTPHPTSYHFTGFQFILIYVFIPSLFNDSIVVIRHPRMMELLVNNKLERIERMKGNEHSLN